ncbi:unnamed protein product [marine sediment metagenome]|uniref:Uncharacterized protein n=1 Tax=marine sediment metagenome TaxID=412755 RepID=X1TN78_9ZZZZ
MHAVILGILIIQESVDVRYYSYWAVLHYLCFLKTLGYTKGNWEEELTQEWGDYVVGSGGSEKFKKEWEEQAIKVKEEKDKIKKAKGKGKVALRYFLCVLGSKTSPIFAIIGFTLPLHKLPLGSLPLHVLR